jgi:amidase
MSLQTVQITTTEHLPLITSVTRVASWEQVARRRQQEINDSMPLEYVVPAQHLSSIHLVNLRKTSGLLTPRELDITSLSATQLLKYIHNETFTSLEVTNAFCKTAAIAHQAVCR